MNIPTIDQDSIFGHQFLFIELHDMFPDQPIESQEIIKYYAAVKIKSENYTEKTQKLLDGSDKETPIHGKQEKQGYMNRKRKIKLNRKPPQNNLNKRIFTSGFSHQKVKIREQRQIKRDCRRSFALSEWLGSMKQFIKMKLKTNQKSVSTTLIDVQYQDLNLKKSKKFFIHYWANLVDQGLATEYFKFLGEVSLPNILNGMDKRYSDKPEYLVTILEQEILRIYQCLKKYQNTNNIDLTINEIYESSRQNHKKIHKSVETAMTICKQQLGIIFPDIELKL